MRRTRRSRCGRAGARASCGCCAGRFAMIRARTAASAAAGRIAGPIRRPGNGPRMSRSEEHTSELQSLMRISYAVFCLKKKKEKNDENKEDTTEHYEENHHIRTMTPNNQAYQI